MEEISLLWFEDLGICKTTDERIATARSVYSDITKLIYGEDPQPTPYLLRQENLFLSNKNNAKTHNVMNLILKDDYVLQLFEEYRLLPLYTQLHGESDYTNQIKYEFEIVNDYISNMLHCNAFYIWQTYFLQLFRKLDRIQSRIESYRDFIDDKHSLYFLTLTLNDNYYLTTRTINRQNYTEIRTKVRKYIANYSDYYVFNKDFGLNDTKRLHFHGVALLTDTEIISFKYHYSKKFGWCKLDPINSRSDLISRYVSKLSQHAMKVNYGFNRENLIFSRNTSIKGIY